MKHGADCQACQREIREYTCVTRRMVIHKTAMQYGELDRRGPKKGLPAGQQGYLTSISSGVRFGQIPPTACAGRFSGDGKAVG